MYESFQDSFYITCHVAVVMKALASAIVEPSNAVWW